MAKGNVPSGELWIEEPAQVDGWLVFSREQEKGEEWRTWKLVAKGAISGRANYWWVRCVDGRVGLGRDLAILRQERPEVYTAVMVYLDGLVDKPL